MTDALFIAVEVDEPVGERPGLAAKLEEVCPVDIFHAGDRGVEIVSREPRRVRAVRAVHQRRAGRHRARDQAVLGRALPA